MGTSLLSAFTGTYSRRLDCFDSVRSTTFSIEQAKALTKLANRMGVTLVLEKDSAEADSTTLGKILDSAGADAFGGFNVKGGVWYEYELFARMTQGTSANGAKLSVILGPSNDQSSAVLFNFSDYVIDTGTPVGTATVAISTNTVKAFSVDDITSGSLTLTNKGVFKGENDGKLIIQYAEKDTGNGSLILKAGSYLRVRTLA